MSAIDDIKQRLDIVDLIGERVPLQKSGRNFKGLCPFHTEKTPSFIVFPDSQNWHCFGACGTGGDIFGFVMRYEHMDFSEALHFLAERAGIELRPLEQFELEQKDEANRLREINAAVAQFYHDLLMNSPRAAAARAYLERRGLTRETITTFQLGYAPDEWHMLDGLFRQKHFDPEDVHHSGLLSQSEGGNTYDRFRNRILFPIRDPEGHVVGFGGRALDDSIPKYLNTPQTALFDEAGVLYGIDLARESIRRSGTAVVVEGYMDVVIPHQCGVTNVVACMGTALTEDQINLLKRMVKVLILALDPDEAGAHAAEKGAEVAQQALEHRIVPVPFKADVIRYESRLAAEIRILTLPEGLDPDELVLQDRSRWDQLVAEAAPVGDYFFQRARAEIDVSQARGKRQAVERLLPVIAAMDNVVERTHYLQRLAQWVHVDERQLLRLEQLRPGDRMTTDRGNRQGGAPPPASLAPQKPVLDLEERCVALLLRAPELLAQMRDLANLSAETFLDTRNRQVFLALEQYAATSETFRLLDFARQLDNELETHVESLLQGLESGPPLSSDMIREDLVKSSARLQKIHLSHLIRELRFFQQDAQEEGQDDRVRELSQSIEQLTRDYLQIDQRYYAATLTGRSKRELRTG